jgi:hypothetical protein
LVEGLVKRIVLRIFGNLARTIQCLHADKEMNARFYQLRRMHSFINSKLAFNDGKGRGGEGGTDRPSPRSNEKLTMIRSASKTPLPVITKRVLPVIGPQSGSTFVRRDGAKAMTLSSEIFIWLNSSPSTPLRVGTRTSLLPPQPNLSIIQRHESWLHDSAHAEKIETQDHIKCTTFGIMMPWKGSQIHNDFVWARVWFHVWLPSKLCASPHPDTAVAPQGATHVRRARHVQHTALLPAHRLYKNGRQPALGVPQAKLPVQVETPCVERARLSDACRMPPTASDRGRSLIKSYERWLQPPRAASPFALATKPKLQSTTVSIGTLTCYL